MSRPRRLPQLTAAIELVSEISRQLNERKTEAVAEITSTFEELERALHQRKTALITDLENICSTKQKVRTHCRKPNHNMLRCANTLTPLSPLPWVQVLQAQLSSLLQGKEHIQSSCSFTEQALSHGSATEVGLARRAAICLSKLTKQL